MFPFLFLSLFFHYSRSSFISFCFTLQIGTGVVFCNHYLDWVVTPPDLRIHFFARVLMLRPALLCVSSWHETDVWTQHLISVRADASLGDGLCSHRALWTQTKRRRYTKCNKAGWFGPWKWPGVPGVVQWKVAYLMRLRDSSRFELRRGFHLTRYKLAGRWQAISRPKKAREGMTKLDANRREKKATKWKC